MSDKLEELSELIGADKEPTGGEDTEEIIMEIEDIADIFDWVFNNNRIFVNEKERLVMWVELRKKVENLGMSSLLNDNLDFSKFEFGHDDRFEIPLSDASIHEFLHQPMVTWLKIEYLTPTENPLYVFEANRNNDVLEIPIVMLQEEGSKLDYYDVALIYAHVCAYSYLLTDTIYSIQDARWILYLSKVILPRFKNKKYAKNTMTYLHMLGSYVNDEVREVIKENLHHDFPVDEKMVTLINRVGIEPGFWNIAHDPQFFNFDPVKSQLDLLRMVFGNDPYIKAKFSATKISSEIMTKTRAKADTEKALSELVLLYIISFYLSNKNLVNKHGGSNRELISVINEKELAVNYSIESILLFGLKIVNLPVMNKYPEFYRYLKLYYSIAYLDFYLDDSSNSKCVVEQYTMFKNHLDVEDELEFNLISPKFIKFQKDNLGLSSAVVEIYERLVMEETQNKEAMERNAKVDEIRPVVDTQQDADIMANNTGMGFGVSTDNPTFNPSYGHPQNPGYGQPYQPQNPYGQPLNPQNHNYVPYDPYGGIPRG